ncbi:hypothetical protein MUP79_06855, partial [Candidatus Bathyarchaeota archaeon]|nr:hypothetical protein [Candidatus Bathyarchaeota archaeon]
LYIAHASIDEQVMLRYSPTTYETYIHQDTTLTLSTLNVRPLSARAIEGEVVKTIFAVEYLNLSTLVFSHTILHDVRRTTKQAFGQILNRLYSSD